MSKMAVRFMCVFVVFSLNIQADVLRVPESYPTISGAIEAAEEGDTVLVARGTYPHDSLLVNKPIMIASAYIYSHDEADIDQTIIQATPSANTQWFRLEASGSAVKGLRINGNNEHSIVISCPYAEISHCRLIGGKDQISFEKGGGYIGYCYLEGAGDDGIDCDNSVSWTIEHNTIVYSHQDAIEVRLQKKKEPLTTHIFRYNTLIQAGESGIQFINYAGNSYREFLIYGNIFKECGGSGISCMYDTQTNEDYKGSDMEEKAFIYNNTIDACNYAITEAPYLVILNNLITNCKTRGISGSEYVTPDNDHSIVDYCNFFNTPNAFGPDVRTGSHLFVFDPLYEDAETYALSSGSGCIDAGTASYVWQEETVLDIPLSGYSGSAPDIGAYEYGSNQVLIPLGEAPETFRLFQNYPNPFNPCTTVWFEMEKAGFIELDIYDLQGKRIRTLARENRLAGAYSIQWDGTGHDNQPVPSGVYIYEIRSSSSPDGRGASKRESKKMMLVR